MRKGFMPVNAPTLGTNNLNSTVLNKLRNRTAIYIKNNPNMENNARIIVKQIVSLVPQLKSDNEIQKFINYFFKTTKTFL